MNKLSNVATLFALAASLVACKKNQDENPILIAPLSDGSTMTLNGLIGAEAGNAAGNSVFVDFSTDKQTSIARDSWDLGFYGGTDFKVIINNTSAAGAKVMDKTDLAEVKEEDLAGQTLTYNQANPKPEDFAYFDDVTGNYTKTVIPTISATDNKVIVLNRGIGGGIAARDWIKLKITRNTTGGYAVQYGTLKQTSDFKSVDVAKDANVNFTYFSFTSGGVVAGQPAKADWDIVWGYSIYQTTHGESVPYPYADLVFTNTLAGVQVAEVQETNLAYAKITKEDLNSLKFSANADVIGSKWRIVPDRTGTGGTVKSNVYYLVKDAAGNVYKLKFISYISGDGGTRGKPVIEYKLVK